MILKAEAIVALEGLRPVNFRQWREAMAAHQGQRVVVTVERHHDRRSSQQNRWYWGAIVPAVAGHLSQGRALPLSDDQAHHVLKSAFIGVEDTPLGPVPKSSAALTMAAFSAYCDAIVAHAASEWGLAIPAPED